MSIIRKYMMKYRWHRYKVAYRARKLVLGHTPREAWIEPTNHCNLRCVMCPQSRGIEAKKGFMDLGLYKKILDQLKKLKVQRINLFMGGESLLHKRFIDMLRLAGEAGVPVRLHTNATLLDGDAASRILECHALEEISFSFDGEDPGYYERVRVNADFGKTLGNIKRFLEIKKERRQKMPRVLIQVIKERTADGRPPTVSEEFKALFEGLPVDKFHPIRFHNFAGTLEAKGDVKYEINKKDYKPCRHPWKSLCVVWDGEVVPCCVDVHKKLVLGDLNRQSVEEVWNGEPMVGLRRALVEGRYEEFEPCRDCDMFWR